MTRTACRAACGKSKCSDSSSETAMLVILKNAPSIAAATVPEYSTLIPAFEPELIPETIRSGGRGISSQIPSLTLSAGLPSTFQPSVGAVDVLHLLDDQGLEQRDRVPHAALLHRRGHHGHVPQPQQLLAQGPQAGGEDAVIVRQEDLHR